MNVCLLFAQVLQFHGEVYQTIEGDGGRVRLLRPCCWPNGNSNIYNICFLQGVPLEKGKTHFFVLEAKSSDVRVRRRSVLPYKTQMVSTMHTLQLCFIHVCQDVLCMVF